MLNKATKSEDNISTKSKVGLDFICIELRNKIIVNMMINIFSVKSVVTHSKTTSCLLIYSARYFFWCTGGADYWVKSDCQQMFKKASNLYSEIICDLIYFFDIFTTYVVSQFQLKPIYKSVVKGKFFRLDAASGCLLIV